MQDAEPVKYNDEEHLIGQRFCEVGHHNLAIEQITFYNYYYCIITV